MKLRLPELVNGSNRFFMIVLTGVFFMVAYQAPNHIHFVQPKILSFTPVDLWTPFFPATFLIYLTTYVLFPICYFLLKEDANRTKLLWGFWTCLFFSSFVFFVYPTTFPRADFPLPEGLNPLLHVSFSLFRMIDDPSNTFPSMHMVSCFISSFCFLGKGESRKLFWINFLWSLAVGFSTMATKQHYFIDAVAGLMIAGAGHWFFFHKVQYVPMEDFKRLVRKAQGEQPAE